jgi:curved DNA-binding protein CbpA
MSPNSSQNDVHLKCKTLARKWHPDKFKDDSMKQEAQQKFIAIQAVIFIHLFFNN